MNRVEELTLGLLDGDLSAEEDRELERLVGSDEEAVRQHVTLLQLDAELRGEFGRGDVVRQALQSIRELEVRRTQDKVMRSLGPARRRRIRRGKGPAKLWLGLGAVAALVIALLSLFLSREREKSASSGLARIDRSVPILPEPATETEWPPPPPRPVPTDEPNAELPRANPRLDSPRGSAKPKEPEPFPKPAPAKPGVRPAPELPAPAPTRTRKPLQVALTLENGSPRDLKWSGARIFTSGDVIKARTALRILWSDARVYLRSGSVLTVKGKEAFALESGAVLLENFGPPFTITTAAGTFREEGTRFLVRAGRRIEAVVYEGRLRCETPSERRNIRAGEHASIEKSGSIAVEAIENLSAYPAWMGPAMARRTPLFSLTFPRKNKSKVRLAGNESGKVLRAIKWEEQFYLGVENDPTVPVLDIPRKGEFWVTYFTATEDPITLRLRATLADSTAFDFIVRRPVPRRWVPVRVSLSRFRAFDGRPLKHGYPIHILIASSADPNLSLRDMAVMEIKE